MLDLRAAAIAILLLAPLALPAGGAQPAACDPVALETFTRVEPLGPLLDHEGWERAVGWSRARLPEVPTLLALGEGHACDLSRGLEAFLGGRATPRDATDAVALTRLALEARAFDVLPHHEVLSARVERGHVEMVVWTPQGGVVADVRMTFGPVLQPTFVVRDVAVGAFTPASEGWALAPGATEAVLGERGGTSANAVLTGPNGDGTTWRVTYFPERYASGAEADAYAQMALRAAQRAYANVTSWGFASVDPDRVLDVRLDGCVCILAGDELRIRMTPRPNDLLAFLPGIAYRSEEELAQVLLGHELFHHVQWGIQGWSGGLWLLEGMARASETLHFPEASHLPTSLVYASDANGMNGYLARPPRGIIDRSYDWAIAWGYLAAHEGGVAFLRAALEESRGMVGDGNVAGPAALDRALARTPGATHATFVEAHRAFADALLTHEGWTWGTPQGAQVRDWSEHLVPLARERTSGLFQLPAWSVQAHDASGGPHGAVGGHSASTYDVVLVRGRAFQAAPPAFAAAPDEDALLVLRNHAPEAGAPYAYALIR